jgi:cobaltochelatase CobN
VSFLGSAELVEGLKEINAEYGDIIDLKVYGAHEIEKELVDVDVFKSDLSSSHAVFIDGRGGDRLGQIISQVLSQTNNTVLTLPPAMSFGSYYSSPSQGTLMQMGRVSSQAMTGGGRFKRLLNWGIGRRIFAVIVHLFDKDIDINAIIDRFDMTSIKDPQQFVNLMLRMTSLAKYMKFIPGVGILRDMRNMALVNMYFWMGGQENMKNLLLLLGREYGNLAKVNIDPPIIRNQEDTIYHPDAPRFFRSLADYKKWRGMEKDATVGLMLYAGQFFEWSRPTVDLLIRTLEKDVNVITVSTSYMGAFSFWRDMEKFFFEDGEPIIDLFIWAPAYHRLTGTFLWAGPKELFRVLQKLDVPVLAPFGMCATTTELWEKSKFIAPLDELCGVMAPELDGAIEPLPACALADQIDSDLRWMKTIPLEDRCLKSCRRALRWINLREKASRDKKVAIVIYNYPPGEDNLGGGAGYLDVFGSLLSLLKGMKERGYSVELPQTKEDLLNLFLDNGQVNTGNWTSIEKTAGHAVNVPAEKYEKWLYNIPVIPRGKMIDSWGDPPGEIMTYNRNILLPGVSLRNVFIGLQPSLGIHENPEEALKAYHDKSTAPIHQYLAFYKWIEEEFDAVIHFGTHGTLEFREGKEVGLSKDCFPDVLIGDLPNIYVYMVDNTSEATIAKRRSYAVMISHSSPAYMASGVYDEYAELEDLIHEYHRARTRDPQRAKMVHQNIMEKARDVHLEGSVEKISDKLFEMKRSVIPKGLHCLGENLDHQGVVEYVTFALRYDRGEVKSLHRIFAEEEGYSYLELVKHPGTASKDTKTHAQVLGDIEGVVKQIIWELASRKDASSVAKGMFSSFEKNPRKDIERTLSFALDLIQRTQSGDEIGGVLNALNGGYILPSKGGDMVRSPEVLPTGRNIYGFDPTKIPTAAAYERGVQIAEQVLEEYLAREGRYPESIGIVLWGFETSNTEGETIGEILRLIGVEVISGLTDRRCGWGYFSDLRVIPLSELGRPRIDVMINICGMFRDMFPNILELLDKAFKMVSELDEEKEQNLVAKHTAELKQRSAELGIDPELCHLRTFGPSQSEYGTGALTSLIETSSWKDEDDLAEAYVSGMKHAYGKNTSAKDAQKMFEYHASKVEVVSQIRDFTDFEITDLDHYYEFSGGLSTAVKKISGKRPEMLISDTTKEIIKIEGIKDAIERGVRTRTLNPKWIDAMLEHGYDGALNIEDRVEYILGLAATTEKVANWIWDEVAERIVFDEEVRQRMEEANPWARQQIIDHLLEAERRGYWQASEEKLEELKEAYLGIEGEIEGR